MKRWMAVLPLLLLAGFAVFAAIRLSAPRSEGGSFASPVRPAPELELSTMSGETVRMADFRGRPVVVNIWATWCAPCKLEHPVLMDMKAQGVPIIGVQHMDTADKADPAAAIERGRTVLERDGNPFLHAVVDPTGDASMGFGIAGVPETFLVDADGQIVKTVRGPLIDRQAEDFLEAYRDLAG